MFRNCGGATQIPVGCQDCKNLYKVIEEKEKLIKELQAELKRNSKNTNTTAARSGLTNAASSEEIGVNLDFLEKVPLSCATLASKETSSSRHEVESIRHQSARDTTQIHSFTPKVSNLKLLREETRYPELPEDDGHHDEVKMITVQEIIDKVLEKSPTREEEEDEETSWEEEEDGEISWEEEDLQNESRLISIQEIINSTVEKSQNSYI